MPEEEEPYWKQRQNAAREAVELQGGRGKIIPPEMTPEQRGKWEGTIKKDEPLQWQSDLGEYAEHRLLGGIALSPGELQATGEVGAGFTLAGAAVDAKDLGVAIKEKDPLMGGLSAAGLVGPFMGFDNIGRQAVKQLRKGEFADGALEALSSPELRSSVKEHANAVRQQGEKMHQEALDLMARAGDAHPLVSDKQAKVLTQLAESERTFSDLDGLKDAMAALAHKPSGMPGEINELVDEAHHWMAGAKVFAKKARDMPRSTPAEELLSRVELYKYEMGRVAAFKDGLQRANALTNELGQAYKRAEDAFRRSDINRWMEGTRWKQLEAARAIGKRPTRTKESRRMTQEWVEARSKVDLARRRFEEAGDELSKLKGSVESQLSQAERYKSEIVESLATNPYWAGVLDG